MFKILKRECGSREHSKWGKLGGVEKRETVLLLFCMREESISNKNFTKNKSVQPK